jgi:hypothetical protein
MARPKVCDTPGQHRVRYPAVVRVVSVSVKSERVVLQGKPVFLICGTKVVNDSYFEDAPEAIKTYPVAATATVVLVKLGEAAPTPVRYRAQDFVTLLAGTHERRDDDHGLDPWFRDFSHARLTTDAAGNVTELAQLYRP